VWQIQNKNKKGKQRLGIEPKNGTTVVWCVANLKEKY